MQVSQTRLPSQSSNVTPSGMTNEIHHTELCEWLKAVAISRDKVAFTRLFKFFAPKIQNIAKKRVNTDTQASEVVQETMSNVWKKAHLFNEDKGAATTWVYTIMRNVTFDMLRKMQSNREDNLSEDIWPLVENIESETQENYTDHLENKQLLSVIEELPENQKQVVKGFYFMEMSQEQLASHLNLPLGTVKSRLRLALAKLKIQLGDSHD